MITVGTTFIAPTPPDFKIEHLYIIIAVKSDEALFVNVTTKRGNADCTCLLKKDDHPSLKHDSVINYAEAQSCKIPQLEQALQKKIFEERKTVSTELLERIVSGTKTSPSFPPKHLKYFK